MRTLEEYLAGTESAMRKLFEGAESYVPLLRKIPSLVTASTSPEDWESQFATWQKQNETEIRAGLNAQREYFSEKYAQAVLCGAILEVAAKGIKLYSTNAETPLDYRELFSKQHRAVKFCIGHRIRSVPLGLVIHAGRNQHAHFNDPELHKINKAVFERLALIREIRARYVELTQHLRLRTLTRHTAVPCDVST